AGKPYADALVLTGIISVVGKKEWKWYSHIQAQRDVIKTRSRSSAQEIGMGDLTPGRLSGDALPTYQEAPLTRPLGPLLDYSLLSINRADEPDPPTDPPPKFTLTPEPPNGTRYEDNRSLVVPPYKEPVLWF
ncbi:hypothetical protein RSAG8_06239, partial [Rhizoctonia solani AG-8 WAC10335]